ncbi:glycoside hydrolase family 105 protein [Emticicia sp. BO119]|uniref:glycoside hydrolase family 88/105 protein n=1 Tax=Emticicia sp. BO119 TaxID=2757768 RepID=UPI0015F0231C|nr:glycoside hydrolase family 88 protein [Emticicia sp. BO119]MBA4853581.1 glycoside hydrolase family 88 protein [Emticicia sp. BO119]
MSRLFKLIALVLVISGYSYAQKQAPAQTLHSDALHTAKPDYPTTYGSTKPEDIIVVLNRVRNYLDKATPTRVVDKNTNIEISDYSQINTNSVILKGDFSLTSYEWGVTYEAMLLAGEVTGDTSFTNYTIQRFKFLADVLPYFKEIYKTNPQTSLRQIITPHALDDCGAMCAAMIRATKSGLVRADLRPIIDNYINYIFTKEFRLKDGTLARNRPLPNTLWLDDMFMGVPAIAQMGSLTGNKKYYDDAVRQVLQFSTRMFNKNSGIYMHGWVQEMESHPEFHWARANGWAILAMVELLEVLPENYPGRIDVLKQLKAHARGLATQQSGTGFWHQLLDRHDSYLETSATAIYTHCIAKAINRGWLDATTYGPMALLGWNAVATKVTEKGQVEGVCVGTGMGFDPAFYYYRPVNVYAAHGYGPVLLAGSEMIKLLRNKKFDLNDSAVMFSK